jgi:hypothetical protein
MFPIWYDRESAGGLRQQRLRRFTKNFQVMSATAKSALYREAFCHTGSPSSAQSEFLARLYTMLCPVSTQMHSFTVFCQFVANEGAGRFEYVLPFKWEYLVLIL